MLIVSYEISLKGLIYYFYHLTTLKHLEDLNMMFLNYLILLLNMGYTEVYNPRTIHAMFALNWLTGFRGEDF
jgi:hypothetical protein